VLLYCTVTSPPYGRLVMRTEAEVAAAVKTDAVTVTCPPPPAAALRMGIVAELRAAVTPHWSVASRAMLESGTAIAAFGSVPTGRTMKPDCEMA
jgi:hypothetical protein